jgi:hypothetical protein
MLTRQTDPAVNWTNLIEDYRDTLLSVPIAEAFGIVADEMSEVLPAAAQRLVREMRPTQQQRMQFWLHRRGRRLGRLPGWYRRANKPVHHGKPVSFIHFTKTVYNVDTARDALAKALRKLRPV